MLEKYFYQHTEGEERLLKRKEIHFFIFFFYYFVIGIVLANLFRISLAQGLLFPFPIIFYAAVSRVSFEEIPIRLREQKFFRILLSLATLFGVLLSLVISAEGLLYHIFLAAVVGAFFYIVIMDFIPREAKGRPGFFLLGLILYTLLITLSWLS